jgi:beta-phosphoglucomutase-like phosphatase (HAD superfamily)
MKSIQTRNKILLFDLDGTLVDTEKLAMKVISEYCAEKRLFSQDTYLKNVSELIIGRTWGSAIQDMILRYSLSLDPVQFEAELKSKYRQHLSRGVDLVPGVLEKLSELKSSAHFMGIVTGSSRDEVEIILRSKGMESFFDQIWSAENYLEGKPSPMPFLTAFEEIKTRMQSEVGMTIDPQDVIVFEDSIAGMESSSSAGFSFVQVLHSHPLMPLDVRALFSIQDWRDLKVSE